MRTFVVFVLVTLVSLAGAGGLLRRDVSALKERISQYEIRLEKLETAKSVVVAAAPATQAPSTPVRTTIDPPSIAHLVNPAPVAQKEEAKTIAYTVVAGDELHIISHKQGLWWKPDMDKYEAGVKKLDKNKNIKDWNVLGEGDQLELLDPKPFITKTRAEANAAVRAARKS